LDDEGARHGEELLPALQDGAERGRALLGDRRHGDNHERSPHRRGIVSDEGHDPGDGQNRGAPDQLDAQRVDRQPRRACRVAGQFADQEVVHADTGHDG
jgi:hypothetical protein